MDRNKVNNNIKVQINFENKLITYFISIPIFYKLI